MVYTRHFELQKVFDADGGPGVFGKVSTQLMELHRRVSLVEAPVVLECGVNQGWSSGVMAHAVEQNGGKLISLDIEDCSDAIVSDCWTFIQTDDSDKERILRDAPLLKAGIDLIYIDSLHAARHVARLLMLWYPLVRQGGWLAFDDVDPGPYLRGQRKDDANREIAWRAISHVVSDFFYANEDDLLLEYHYGSTGLALMQKLAPMSKAPNPPRRIPRRRLTLRSFARLLARRG
jgi:predicted O-methyltransferase YrrM